jgi:hypothetical protein
MSNPDKIVFHLARCMTAEHTPSLDYLASFISDGGGLTQVQAADKRILGGGIERHDCDRRQSEIEDKVSQCGFIPIKRSVTSFFW